jgi:hypothetical protein
MVYAFFDNMRVLSLEFMGHELRGTANTESGYDSIREYLRMLQELTFHVRKV